MLNRTALITCLLYSASTVTTAFVVKSTRVGRSNTKVYGLFDGVKEAFKAPALERSTLNSERETPIDRWMGWSVVSENEVVAASAQAGELNNMPVVYNSMMIMFISQAYLST